MKLFFLIATIIFCVPSLDCQFNRNKYNPRLNFFDAELLRYAAGEKRGNVMVSPASVKTTLAMILQGSIGQTAFEIQKALRLSPEKEELRREFTVFLNALQANSTNTALQNANGIFVAKGLRLNGKYDDIVRRDYLSEITPLDFGDQKSAALAINGWVSQKTHGFIPFVIEPEQISHATNIILANALYFKSTWHNSFDSKLTRSGCFFKDKQCHNVAMMSLEAELNYAYVDELRAHALELPYEDKRFSMILLVPIDQDGVDDLVFDLPYVSLQHIHDLMRPTDVELSMPKFTVNYNEDLITVLKKLRISTVFSPQANLSGIFEGHQPSYVSSFQHKVFMSVDEAGTVAAAASSSSVVPLIYNTVQIRVDKPFVFFIRDNNLGVVLFEGKIEEPTPYAGGQIQQPGPVIDQRMFIPASNTANNSPQKQSNSFINNVKKLFG